MVTGKLLKFLENRFEGDVLYTSVTPNMQLGGLTPIRQTIPLSLTHPRTAILENALLEIGVLVPSTNINWRVKLNGVSITKEFKPHVVSESGNMYFAKLVYDVTSILKTPESQRRRRANITFKLEGGNKIVVEQLTLVALYSSKEAEAAITYYSGALSLKPGESTNVNFNKIFDEGLMRTTLYMPSKIARGKLLLNNKPIFEISNTQGMEEFLAPITGLDKENNLGILHEETDTAYYPKEMRVSNIVLYSVKYMKPELVIDENTIPEKIKKGTELELSVINNGESTPDKALLVVMSLGNVIARKNIKRVEPGEKTTEKIKLNLQPGEYELVFRVIWNKLSKTWFKDIRRKIHILE